MRLDTKTVARLELDEKRNDVIVFDSQLIGFGFRLRRGANGAVRRSWVAQYRSDGQTRRVRIGNDLLSATQARAQAEQILARSMLGQDPSAERNERRVKDRMTVRAVVAEYLAAKQDLRPKTRRELTRYLTHPGYFGTLHRLPIDKISRKHIAAALVVIGRERGMRTACLARAAIAAFYSWSLQMGFVETNPTIGTVRFEVQQRDRVLTDDELVAVWRASGDDDFGKITKLLILTGQRRGEIGGMRWSEIDSDKATWTLPAERSKNHRSHSLPLMPAVLEILGAIPQQIDRDQIFGASCPLGFSAWVTRKKTLDATANIDAWTLHDLRRTTATKMADIGVAPHIIETILNHVSGHKGGVAGIYNKSRYVTEVRNALVQWEGHIHSLVDGSNRKVVSLREREIG